MADYTIEVTFPSLTLVNMTAAQIVQAINDSEEIIDADNVESTGSSGGTMTASQIVTAINASSEEIDKDNIEQLIKTDISHAEKALNLIYTGDPRKTSFQTEWATGILANDYLLVAEVNQVLDTMANGDWLIARVDNPGFIFSDTDKWERKRFLPTTYNNVFRQHDSGAVENQSGIETIPGLSVASGNHSFAPGYANYANGEGSSSFGKNARATRTGEVVESTGMFSETGDVQRGRFAMKHTTTNAVASEMTSPGKFACEADRTYILEIRILARVGASGLYVTGQRAKEWKYRFLVSRTANGYILHDGGLQEDPMSLGSPNISVSVTIVPVIGDATTPPSPGVFMGLKIECTGLSATTIRWAAFIDYYELKYA